MAITALKDIEQQLIRKRMGYIVQYSVVRNETTWWTSAVVEIK